ncbi:MAG: hypothetical protein PVG93_04690 [Phycisphaerales bacterium]
MNILTADKFLPLGIRYRTCGNAVKGILINKAFSACCCKKLFDPLTAPPDSVFGKPQSQQVSAKFLSIIATEISYAHTRITKIEKRITGGKHIPFRVGFYISSVFNITIYPFSQSNFCFSFHWFNKPKSFQAFSYGVAKTIKPVLNRYRNFRACIFGFDEILNVDFRCFRLPFGNFTKTNPRSVRRFPIR